MHVMRLIRNGAGAGLFAGLLIAGREVAMMEEQRQWLSEPLTYLPWPSLTVLIYALLGAAVGAVIGIALSLVLRRRTPDQRQSAAVWLAPVTAGALILFFTGLYSRDSMTGWPELLALVLLAMGVTLAVRERSGDVPFSRWLSIGVSALVGEMAFFLAADQVADAEGWHWAARAGAYLGTLAVAAAIGWGVARLLGWVGARIADRWGDRAFTYGLTGLLVVPMLVLSVVGLVSLAMPASDELALPASSSQTSADDPRPNVILISVDTLRADFVGYAGGPARTPNIDALAAESYVFENAYSVAPCTRPSFASFFSSRYPSEMGVARVRGIDGSAGFPAPRWRDDRKLMAEVFRDAGYATAAVVTNWVLIPETGANRGFDTFCHCSYGGTGVEAQLPACFPTLIGIGQTDEDQHRRKDENERASIVTIRAESVLQSIQSRPLYFWVHYMDPHAPYDPPTIPEEMRVRPPTTEALAGYAANVGTERSRWLAAYVAEVEYFDSWLGKLIDVLRETGLWDSAITVFWSDHGEEFWEHGGVCHGTTLYNELLRVPLLIHMPTQADGQVVQAPVTLLDVMPTLLIECDLEIDLEMRGRQLQPLLAGETPQQDPIAFAEGAGLGPIRKSLIAGDLKLIYDVYADAFELYDLVADPGELHNIQGMDLAPDMAREEERLRAWTEQALELMDEQAGRMSAEDVPPEVLERLRDMGYIQ